MIKIHFFAILRDYVGAKSIDLEVPEGITIGEIRNKIIGDYPALEKVRDSMMAAMNREYASDEKPVPSGSEVAFFPPVSGG